MYQTWIGPRAAHLQYKNFSYPFTLEFLKWTLPSLNLYTHRLLHIGVSVIIHYQSGNSVDFNETALDEPSHLDLPGLQRSLYWSAEMKVLRGIKTFSKIFYLTDKTLFQKGLGVLENEQEVAKASKWRL